MLSPVSVAAWSARKDYDHVLLGVSPSPAPAPEPAPENRDRPFNALPIANRCEIAIHRVPCLRRSVSSQVVRPQDASPTVQGRYGAGLPAELIPDMIINVPFRCGRPRGHPSGLHG